MSVKEVKAKYKWRKDYSPLVKIDHCIVTAFITQHIITINFFYNMLWFEFLFSNHLSTFKIGIGSMYFIVGGGINE
jgi:hypothetical protein